MRCHTIGSCQSAATSEIVNAAVNESYSRKWRYSKCPDLYLYLHLMCVCPSLFGSIVGAKAQLRVTIRPPSMEPDSDTRSQ